jgi:hypothetical protein
VRRRRYRHGLPVPTGIRHVIALRLAAARQQAAADKKLRKMEEQRARQMRIDSLADRLREAGWTMTGRATYAFKNAGFPLERISGSIGSTLGGFWVAEWAMNLYLKLKATGVSSRRVMAALREAKGLGKPGPLAEAILVAGKMLGA